MSLTHSQRTRLILKTRKLSAILGDTPTVTISASPTPTSSHPEHSTRSPSPPRINITFPNPSLPSLSSPTDSVHRSPLSPTFNPPNIDTILSPSSPTSDDVSDARRMRRRRIAKLARTFGENVPPELIMAHSGSRAEQLDDNIDQGCETSSVMSCEFHDCKSDTDSISSNLSLISLSGAFLPPGLTITTPSRRLSYMSCENNIPFSRGLCASSDVSGRGSDAELAFRHSYTEGRSQRLTVNVRQKKQSWTGEWNQDDMEAVQNKLRKLK
ncbi:hypothetical protein L218DRAFT_1078465 [Marasmius fiardii PR-910]|nr:hypothetical protein L218DRAFT_1078465 [Marasmius fiardii PR-910]